MSFERGQMLGHCFTVFHSSTVQNKQVLIKTHGLRALSCLGAGRRKSETLLVSKRDPDISLKSRLKPGAGSKSKSVSPP